MLAELLIGASFAIASYQDIKDRAVSDIVWVPALIGAAYAIYSAFPDADFALAKLGLIGGIALAFALIGMVGEADAIALAFVAADPSRLSPIVPLVAGAAVAAAHIGYELAKGDARGTKTIPMERFLKEQKWIPKAVVADGARHEVSSDVNVARDEVEAMGLPGAMVEAKYGVPEVAYLGAGYILFLAYLLATNASAFLSVH